MSDFAPGTLRKGSHLLTTIEDWHRHAPPKREVHWKDGRSAKESARAWIDAAPGLQSDIARTLAACPDIGPLRNWWAEPEARVAIDSFRGEPPNIDLLIVGADDRGPAVVAVEAKADEAFGNRLVEQYRRAHAALASNCRSKAVARIDALLDRFGLDMERPRVADLRYQLLTAAAAVLAEAERRSSARAIFVVHEFVTPLTLPERRERNSADLDRFLATAFGGEVHLAPCDVAGPFAVDGGPALYVGKAQTLV